MGMKWEEIPIFISSTFNDMHAERDYLLKNVFPQLGEWCERRHVILRDIDLRWGITSIDSETGNTIYKCLTAVDSCRPFFLCFLGQRRGYVPPLEKLNEKTRTTFPEIVEMARTGSHSATEYEIEHALLMPLAYFENGALHHRDEPVKNALFLRRRPAYLASLSPAQKKVFLDYRKDVCDTPEGYAAFLDACRKANETCCRRISEKNLVVDYDCRWCREIFSPELRTNDPDDDRAQGRLTDFSIQAHDLPWTLRKELEEILQREFPQELPSGDVWPLKAFLLASLAKQILPYARLGTDHPDSYARDAEQQQVFQYTCLKDAIPRADDLKAMAAYFADGNDRRPMVILAEAGMGKTTLLAQFARNQPEQQTVSRFLGVSELSGGLLPLWDSILRECGLPAPENIDALKARLPGLLAEMAPRLLILDGLEQIPGGLDMLELLPAPLPPRLKVILSVRSDLEPQRLERTLRFHKENLIVHSLHPFNTEQKKELVDTCLKSSLKELTDDQMNLVCGLNESGNPLYLSILLSDIRSFSSSSRLIGEIQRHGNTPLSAFDAMLSRMENDRMYDMLPPEKCVPLVFGLLAQSRDGLSYEELAACLTAYFPEAAHGTCSGSIQICLRQVRAFLCRRDGRTDFLHQTFREAAKARYSTRADEFHACLARLFRNACDPDGSRSFPVPVQRALREYAWHLSFVSKAAYRQLYANICYLNARCEGLGVRTLIQEYGDSSLLTDLSPYRDLLIRYRDGLEQYANLLPSLLWAYGSDRQRAEAGFDRLTCPWVRAEDMHAAGSKIQSLAEARKVRLLGEVSIHAAAFCIAEKPSLAFAFTGQGKVTAYALESLLPLSNPLFTDRSLPLGLCASGSRLAAAFENGRIELYDYQADGGTLRAKPLGSLTYVPPMYSGAAMAFDPKGRLWYQEKEESIARYDPASGETLQFALPGAEELSSLAAAGETVFGTACAGLDTLLFSVSAAGGVCSRNLGGGDSRVLCADEKGCLVSCAASEGVYPLLLADTKLETEKESRLESPVTAALPIGSVYLLLPAKQPLGQLWLWDGGIRGRIEQRLLYQDQACLGAMPDGSVALISAGTVSRFCFEGEAHVNPDRDKRGPEPPALTELPDLSKYILNDVQIFASGDYACAVGISGTMKSVRDEQCAGAVFLKKTLGHWHIVGDQTWPRAFGIILTVCIDSEKGVFTLVLRSAVRAGTLCALQGTAKELLAGGERQQELDLPIGRKVCGCCRGGRLWLASGNILLVYEARTIHYETGILLPAPVREIFPFREQTMVRFAEQTAAFSIS